LTVRTWTEFWCPYCQAWLTDIVHRPDHHNDPLEVDEIRTDNFRHVSTNFPVSDHQLSRTRHITTRGRSVWHEDT
jgi:hypothetical protein